MTQKSFSRRDLLRYSATLAVLSLSPPLQAAVLPENKGATDPKNTLFFLPGYRPHQMRYKGIPLSLHPEFTDGIADGYQGPKTMVSRFKWNGEVQRKVFPLKGHQITVSRHSPLAFFNSIDHPNMVAFSRDSLDFDRIVKCHSPKFMGGGHALFTDDGCCLINLERRNMLPFRGRIDDHYGAIVIRDPLTMKVMTVYSCYGVNPHEIRMIDNHTVAISNYGSSDWPLDRQKQPYPYIIEPSITVVDIKNGALLEKFIGPDKEMEVRHLAIDTRGDVLAIQTRLVKAADEEKFGSKSKQIYEADGTVDRRLWFAPAPLLSTSSHKISTISTPDPMNQRQGQSMLYDPQYDEFIITYTSSHRIVVVAARSGAIKRVIPTDHLGIQYPRGIQFLPDHAHYAISGSWRNIRLFKRGDHTPNAIRYETFLGHSHMTTL